MKLRVAPILLALLLPACARDEAPPPPVPASPAAVAKAPAAAAAPRPAPAGATLVDAYLAAWNAHDIAGVGSFLADDASYFEASVGAIQRSRASAEENAIGVIMRAMPDLRRELRGAPIVAADGIAFEWTLTGTNTGTWSGIPASRQKVNIKGVTVMRLREGKIVEQADYYNVESLNRQLGW